LGELLELWIFLVFWVHYYYFGWISIGCELLVFWVIFFIKIRNLDNL